VPEIVTENEEARVQQRRWFAQVVAATLIVAGTWAGTVSPAGADDTFVGAIPGEYLVELKPEGRIDVVAGALGVTAPPEQLADGSAVFRLLLDPAADPVAVVSMLTNTEGVEQAQPNFAQESVGGLGLRKRFFTDVDPAVVTTSATAYTARQATLGTGWQAPRNGTAGAGTTVAVLDTGIDLTHPALRPILVPGYDVVDRDTRPAEVRNGIDDDRNGAVDEAFGHGTYVAGLVALVAPQARVMPIRVLDTDGTGSTWRLMQGIAHARVRGANVINMSLGGASGGVVFDRFAELVQAQGILLVGAAGNDASEAYVHPAATEGVVGVTAIDGRTGLPAGFANRGSWIDVAAPGVQLTSTFPGGRYARWGGTSAAAPLVAGLLAVIRSADPSRPITDIVDDITSTANANLTSGLSAYGTVQPVPALAAR
jgi:subtilisin family serine protease